MKEVARYPLPRTAAGLLAARLFTLTHPTDDEALVWLPTFILGPPLLLSLSPSGTWDVVLLEEAYEPKHN